MLIEYRIRYERGELIITQRVECGRSGAALKGATTENAAEAPAATPAAAPAATPVAAPAATPAAAPAAPAGALNSNSLGSSATGTPIPPVYAPSAAGLIVIMGPVILTRDALEGGSGEPTTTGTDTTP